MKLHQSVLASLSILFFSVTASAQEFLPISDVYSCGRLADGKLHVVKVLPSGFKVYKKGVIREAYEKEIEKIDKRLEVLTTLEKEVKKGTFDKQEANKLISFIKALNGGGTPTLTTRDQRLANIGIARLQFKQRKKNIKIYIDAVKKCDGQRYPGLDAIGATVVPIFVRGSVESSAGFLVSVPKPSSNSTSVTACLKFNSPNPFGGYDVAAFAVTFANSICSFNAYLYGDGVLDCRGPVPAGQLSYYVGKIQFFERSPDPGSSSVVNAIAQLSAAGSAYGFKVIPVKAAPGKDCRNIR